MTDSGAGMIAVPRPKPDEVVTAGPQAHQSGEVGAMADPLTIDCPHCGATAGQRCMMVSDWARKPHAARIKAAAALGA